MAANNGEVGGGEVMLLATARLVAGLGVDVEVVGPDAPGGVLDLASAEGFPVHRLAGERRRYLHDLREWHGRRRELLWCHGLVPAFATAGRPRRVVHLHKLPSRAQRAGYLTARSRASLTLVPSRWMAARVPGARVLPNWTADLAGAGHHRDTPLRLGYLGRHSVDKGLVVLAGAMESLPTDAVVRLVLAGGPRFVDDADRRAVEGALHGLSDDLVEHVGWVAAEAFLGEVDALVVPSVAPESFGLAAAEAMSAGLACIVSDAGALPEVVGPTHPWISRAGDPRSLARAVGEWAGADRRTLDEVTAGQRRRWEAEYSPEVARERVRAILEILPGIGTGKEGR